MKIGFTGTQEGMAPLQQEYVLEILELLLDEEGDEFHHGDCEGADAQAHILVRTTHPEVELVLHPPKDDKKRAYSKGAHAEFRPLPYLERNHRIVNRTDVLIACPRGPEEQRSGTWATVRYAMKVGKPIFIIPRQKS